MKPIITGLPLAARVAVDAALVLDREVQRSTADRFQTDAVRL